MKAEKHSGKKPMTGHDIYFRSDATSIINKRLKDVIPALEAMISIHVLDPDREQLRLAYTALVACEALVAGKAAAI